MYRPAPKGNRYYVIQRGKVIVTGGPVDLQKAKEIAEKASTKNRWPAVIMKPVGTCE